MVNQELGKAQGSPVRLEMGTRNFPCIVIAVAFHMKSYITAT